jgi:hypothetical protein
MKHYWTVKKEQVSETLCSVKEVHHLFGSEKQCVGGGWKERVKGVDNDQSASYICMEIE